SSGIPGARFRRTARGPPAADLFLEFRELSRVLPGTRQFTSQPSVHHAMLRRSVTNDTPRCDVATAERTFAETAAAFACPQRIRSSATFPAKYRLGYPHERPPHRRARHRSRRAL